MNINCANVSIYFPQRLQTKIYGGEKRIKLEEIQMRTGISTRTIRRWLHSECEPTIELLHRLCKEFDWDYDELVGYPNEPRLFLDG